MKLFKLKGFVSGFNLEKLLITAFIVALPHIGIATIYYSDSNNSDPTELNNWWTGTTTIASCAK